MKKLKKMTEATTEEAIIAEDTQIRTQVTMDLTSRDKSKIEIFVGSQS